MERIAGGDFGDFPSQSERGCKYTRTEGHHHSHGEPDGGGAAPRDHHASLAHIIGRLYGERKYEKRAPTTSLYCLRWNLHHLESPLVAPGKLPKPFELGYKVVIPLLR